MARKYCKECYDLIHHEKNNINYKVINCIDCGCEIKINKFDSHSCRCVECQEKQDILKNRERVKNFKINQKNVG